jgi:hypothetical protein
VLDRQPKEFWTMDVPASWIQSRWSDLCSCGCSLSTFFFFHSFPFPPLVNLGGSKSLIVNYYTLRHGGNSKGDALRNWTLQASNDGKSWVVLRRHVNDMSLNGPFASASWPLESKQKFAYFRVLQTGRNSSHTNFLSLSGFELYGALYTNKKESGYDSP